MGLHRIRGALANLGHEIGGNTVKRLLCDHGITPAPERSQRTPWQTFLQAHWNGLGRVIYSRSKYSHWTG